MSITFITVCRDWNWKRRCSIRLSRKCVNPATPFFVNSLLGQQRRELWTQRRWPSDSRLWPSPLLLEMFEWPKVKNNNRVFVFGKQWAFHPCIFVVDMGARTVRYLRYQCIGCESALKTQTLFLWRIGERRINRNGKLKRDCWPHFGHLSYFYRLLRPRHRREICAAQRTKVSLICFESIRRTFTGDSNPASLE